MESVPVYETGGEGSIPSRDTRVVSVNGSTLGCKPTGRGSNPLQPTTAKSTRKYWK